MALPPLTPGRLSRIYLHGYDISGDTTQSDMKQTYSLLEGVTFLGRQQIAGPEKGSADVKGYLTGTEALAAALHNALSNPDSARYFADVPDASTPGNPVYGGLVKATGITVNSPAAGIITLDGSVELMTPSGLYADRNPYRGRLLDYQQNGFTFGLPLTTVHTTPVNMGASIGGQFYLHYTMSYHPLTNYLTVYLQHAATSGGSYTNFSAATTQIQSYAYGPKSAVVAVGWRQDVTDGWWRLAMVPTGENQLLNFMAWGQVQSGSGIGLGEVVTESDVWMADGSDIIVNA